MFCLRRRVASKRCGDSLLDLARGYGCELVATARCWEHLDSLLERPRPQAQDLRTFKLVDQLSGRSLGVRADMTPQVARIDAHSVESPWGHPALLLRPGGACAPEPVCLSIARAPAVRGRDLRPCGP